MAEYAVLDAGVIVEIRVIDDWDSYAQHKKDALDEKGDWGPVIRPLEWEGSGSTITYVVEPTRVRAVRSQPPPNAVDVKTEAQRRIYELYPQWKQANMTARAVELLQKGQQNWTMEEQAEAAALNDSWAWIKHIRQKSNKIEQLDPIPADYQHDSYWDF